jgi:cytochrome c-type biogenesis protein CcmH
VRRVVVLALLLVGAFAVLTTPVGAEPRFGMDEIESELMCPTCQSRLDMSYSPAADRIRAFIEERRQAGWTKDEVKEALVADFGPAVLAAPPARGIGLLAWLVPLVALVVGIAAVLAIGIVWRRRGSGPPPPSNAAARDPEIEARIDAELAHYDDESA